MMMIYRIWSRGRISRVKLSRKGGRRGGEGEGEGDERKATRYVQAK